MRAPLRLAALSVGLVLGPAGVHAAARNDAGVIARLACRPEAAPGRVLCELQLTAPSDGRLVWADALVTRAPEFVRPLRSRVTPERSQNGEAGDRKVILAFVAGRSGVGQIEVRARAVVCRGVGEAERCSPVTIELSTQIRVG